MMEPKFKEALNLFLNQSILPKHFQSDERQSIDTKNHKRQYLRSIQLVKTEEFSESPNTCLQRKKSFRELKLVKKDLEVRSSSLHNAVSISQVQRQIKNQSQERKKPRLRSLISNKLQNGLHFDETFDKFEFEDQRQLRIKDQRKSNSQDKILERLNKIQMNISLLSQNFLKTSQQIKEIKQMLCRKL